MDAKLSGGSYVIFGWSSLARAMKEDGMLDFLCEENGHSPRKIPIEESLVPQDEDTCRIQKEIFLSSLVQTCTLAAGASILFLGFFFDSAGPRLGALLGLVMLSFVCYLFSGEFFVTRGRWLNPILLQSATILHRSGPVICLA